MLTCVALGTFGCVRYPRKLFRSRTIKRTMRDGLFAWLLLPSCSKVMSSILANQNSLVFFVAVFGGWFRFLFLLDVIRVLCAVGCVLCTTNWTIDY